MSSTDGSLLSLFSLSYYVYHTTQPRRRRRKGLKLRHAGRRTSIECTMVQIHALYPHGVAVGEHPAPEEEANGGWCCEDAEGNLVPLEGFSPDFFESLDPSESGSTRLAISLANKVKKRVVIGVNRERDAVKAIKVLPGAKLSLNRKGKRNGRALELLQGDRRLITSNGTRRVLVVRISDEVGHSPSKSGTELMSDIFEDTLNLRKQYLACSGNQLDFVPATAEVVEVTVAGDISGLWRSDVRNWAAKEVSALGFAEGVDYEHVMYVTPGVVDFNGAGGVAGLGASYSQYNDHYASQVLVQMHEIGHNLVRAERKGNWFCYRTLAFSHTLLSGIPSLGQRYKFVW